MTTMTTKFRDVEIRAPRGTELTAKSWLTEAPLRMLMNNLDPTLQKTRKSWLYTVVLAVQHETGNVSTKL